LPAAPPWLLGCQTLPALHTEAVNKTLKIILLLILLRAFAQLISIILDDEMKECVEIAIFN
jgi:hypothetical protein